MTGFPSLTWLTLLPFLGGLIVIGFDGDARVRARRLGYGASGLTLALAIWLATGFDRSTGELQWIERAAWIPSLAVEYFVGVDGLGLAMVLLTAGLVPLALLLSGQIEERVPLYVGLVLFLEAGLIGTFTALNFFHWFLFWELSLIPAFFLIRFWGGPARAPAATQFFLYTMVGSVALLLAFLAIFLATGKFDFLELAELGRNGRLPAFLNVRLGWYELSADALAMVVFVGVFLGFAVKVPVMPFHVWLPSAYAEAPTGVTMLLTGAMSKMGVYGFLRIVMPIFPEQMKAVSTLLLGLAVFTIVASASAAFAQKDLKRMLAYSSINHLGYCLLGLFAAVQGTGELAAVRREQAAALNGVVVQMVNHGLTAAVLFGFVGWLEQRAGGARGVDDFGGLRRVAPVFCGLMGISAFASLGLPGLNGFVGEFLIFKGSFGLASWAAALAVLGLLATAVFLLSFMQRVFHGPLNPRWASFADLSWRECAVMAPAIGLMFLFGLWPQSLVGWFNATVLQWVEQLPPGVR